MSQKEDAEKFIKMITSVFVQHPPVVKYPDMCSLSSKDFFMSQMETELSFKSQKLAILTKTSHSFSAPSDTDTIHSRLHLSYSNKLYIGSEKRSKSSSSILKIFIYPIKSCRALTVSNWHIGERGLLYDREWMIVDQSGVCLTQKQEPYLCLLQPTIYLEEEMLQLDYPGKYAYKVEAF